MTLNGVGTPFVLRMVNLILKKYHHVSKKKQFNTTKFDE